jgi:hypothetical protein
MTLGLGTVGMACPPCEQVTVAPRWSKKPGIRKKAEGLKG